MSFSRADQNTCFPACTTLNVCRGGCKRSMDETMNYVREQKHAHHSPQSDLPGFFIPFRCQQIRFNGILSLLDSKSIFAWFYNYLSLSFSYSKYFKNIPFGKSFLLVRNVVFTDSQPCLSLWKHETVLINLQCVVLWLKLQLWSGCFQIRSGYFWKLSAGSQNNYLLHDFLIILPSGLEIINCL